MRRLLIITSSVTLLLAAHQAASQSPSAELRIKVYKQAWRERQLHPFSGVGEFDFLRGNGKFEGASCPDRSNANGELSCKIVCNPNVNDTVTLRVRPPSNKDFLTGWVTPPSQEIEVQRCLVRPAVIAMQYEDSRVALNKLLLRHDQLAAASGGGENAVFGEQWLTVIHMDAVTIKFASEAATSKDGRTDLADLYRIASEGAKLLQLQRDSGADAERKQAEAFAKWQLLSKSALLEAKIINSLPELQRRQIQLTPTADLIKYRANLISADQLLSKLPKKSNEQLMLADDIKTLKSQSSIGKDAASATTIIDKWK